VGISRTEDGADQLIGLPIEDQERMEHVLPEVAVIATPLLLPVGGIIRAVEVKQDVVWNAVGGALRNVELDQPMSQVIAGTPINVVLEAGEGGLTSEVGIVLELAATDKLQERIMAKGIRVVLVLVATRDLEDALTDQRMMDGTAAPIRNDAGKRGAEAKGVIGCLQPQKTTITGQGAKVK